MTEHEQMNLRQLMTLLTLHLFNSNTSTTRTCATIPIMTTTSTTIIIINNITPAQPLPAQPLPAQPLPAPAHSDTCSPGDHGVRVRARRPDGDEDGAAGAGVHRLRPLPTEGHNWTHSSY